MLDVNHTSKLLSLCLVVYSSGDFSLREGLISTSYQPEVVPPDTL